MDNELSLQSQFPQVCIVEASAGSGKTYTLAKQYVWLLMNPLFSPKEEIPLNTILAITFTNKAAVEMKERILELLKKIALDTFVSVSEKNDIMSSLCVDKQTARKKAYRIVDYLIRNYNFFQVQTIDSFINTILSGSAFRLDLSAGFKTEKDYKAYVAYSLDTLIDKAGDDTAVFKLFEGFLKQYIYIENKINWLPKQNILSAITSLFAQNNRYAGIVLRNDIEAEDLIASKKDILRLMNKLCKCLPEGTHAVFLKSLQTFLSRNKDSFDIDDLSDYFKREEPPVKKGKVIPHETQRLWENLKRQIRKLCELESSSVFNYYISIFNEVLREVKTRSNKDDILFLEALNKEAHYLFDGALTLPELYYRLACHFKHFLLDEFQDTSNLQWVNLFPMIEEALSTKGSLFYVGDKKQAIYRFRGSEVSLIDTVKARLRGIKVTEKSLNTNYRSQKEIVEFNNMIFSRDNLERFLNRKEEFKKGGIAFSTSDREEIIKIFDGSSQVYREDKPYGYVQSCCVEYATGNQSEDALKDKVLSVIEELRNRFALKEIALLVRKNSDVQLLTSWLLEKDIPVESEKTLDIKQNSYIKELVSFLKFLNSPIDNLSFASFILGDIFCRAANLDVRQIHDFIFDFRRKDTRSVYLYREFRQRFTKVWDELIEDFFKNVGFVPLYELVVSILRKFNAVKEFSAYQGFFMRFLELIREQEERRASISSFLEFFDDAREDDLYVNVTEADAVKIVTIHKAKGLEFPVVILPLLEMNVKTDSELVVPDGDNVKLMYMKRKYQEYSPFIAELAGSQYLKSFIDELNCIYVAFTRAQKELYIFVSQKAKNSLNLGSLLLPENEFKRGKKLMYNNEIIGGLKPLPTIEIPPSEYKDWVHQLSGECIEKRELEARKKILRGEVMHSIFSFIGNLHNQDKNKIVAQALKNTECKFPFIRDFEEFKLYAARLLEDARLEPYFNVADGHVYLEKEIIDSFGNTKRIDRLIVKPQEAWIIDYKSTKEDRDGYRTQICEYIKIVQDIYSDLKVKGFLIYLEDFSIDEFNGTDNNL